MWDILTFPHVMNTSLLKSCSIESSFLSISYDFSAFLAKFFLYSFVNIKYEHHLQQKNLCCVFIDCKTCLLSASLKIKVKNNLRNKYEVQNVVRVAQCLLWHPGNGIWMKNSVICSDSLPLMAPRFLMENLLCNGCDFRCTERICITVVVVAHKNTTNMLSHRETRRPRWLSCTFIWKKLMLSLQGPAGGGLLLGLSCNPVYSQIVSWLQLKQVFLGHGSTVCVSVCVCVINGCLSSCQP